MSVKFIKFKCGDEIIGKIIKNDKKDVVTVENSLRIILTHEGMGTIPYLPFCKSSKHDFPATEILVMDDVDKEMEDRYNQNFSEIVIPSANASTIKLR
jgi:hypothetical protein